MLRSCLSFTIFTTFVVFFSFSTSFVSTEAYGGANTKGNITIKWDIVQWTADGYVSLVTIYNFQKVRRIQSPGWRLGWTWAKKEIIWAVVGAQVTRQGDCSRFKRNIPSSSSKNPTIIDLKSNAPYNQRIANCCRGGVLSSWFHCRPHSISSFQISVGRAGTTNRTVQMAKNVTFNAPKDRYICGPVKNVDRTTFVSADKRRMIQAFMTWKSICLYSGAKSSTT